jgi:rubredoxin
MEIKKRCTLCGWIYKYVGHPSEPIPPHDLDNGKPCTGAGHTGEMISK